MGATPTRDTVLATPEHTIFTILRARGGGQFTRITIDAENDRVLLNVIDAAGAPVEAEGSIHVKLEDAHGEHVRLRETKACDENGNTVYCMAMRSTFYSTPHGSDFD